MEKHVNYHYYIVIDEISGMTLYYDQMTHEWTPNRKKASSWLWAEPAEKCLEDDTNVSKFPSARIAKVKTTIEEIK